MTDKPADTKLIFAEALHMAPEERKTYLDQVCGTDDKLRQHVEVLLNAYAQAGDDFLEVSPLDDEITLDAEPTEGPGTVIGPYKLLERIGEGGMAVVYMAQQERPVQRRVALKIIKLGMDTKQVIARFEAERQALALMDHPNIAKVFDAGTTDTGRPYFVMELVRGISITAFCDQEKLSMPERLGLFMEVCNAVQHAHQRGIIHRDLKPSNIMVTMDDDRPLPKVIDFGIAKATNQRLTEKTVFTRYAQMIGTPAYMSPEQAQMSALDIDTRSDIYSLGVLLYELLTGTVPFGDEELHQAGYLEMQRIIREEEPARPSTKLSTLGDTITEIAKQRCCTPDLLRKTMRGDLDWIVMKSLEKKRTRRYETPSAFKRDIQRYLDHEPVEARKPSAAYRLRKYLYRHRVHAIVAVAAVVLIGAMIALIAMADARGEAERIDHERALLEAYESVANENHRLALKQLEPIQSSKYVGPEARLLYASLLVEDGRIEPAEVILKGLFEEDPQIAGEAHYQMVRLLHENKSPYDAEARVAIEEHEEQAEALALQPQNAKICFIRALSSPSVNEKLRWLDQALSIDRHHYESRRLRAWIYNAPRKYEQLRNDAQIMVFQKDKEALGYALLATALENLGHDSRALAQYDTALELTPLDDLWYPLWFVQRCDVLLRLGQYDRVIADVRAYVDYLDQPSDDINEMVYSGTSHNNRVYLDFCIFYALTGQGRYEEAGDLYQQIASPAVRSSQHLRSSYSFRNWSKPFIFHALKSGRSWHAPGRAPQGTAFDAMHEAADAYRHMPTQAEPLTRGFAPDWSPDGSKLAFSLGALANSGVAVYDLTSRETDLLITCGRDPSWSPDGKHIAFLKDRQFMRFSTLVINERHRNWTYSRFREVWIMDADGANPRRICEGTFPCWSQANPNVLYYYSDADLMLYSIDINDAKAEAQPVLASTNWYSTRPNSRFQPLQVSPDDRYVAKLGIDTLEILDLEQNNIPVSQWTDFTRPLEGNWAPSGRQFSLGTNGSGLWIFDLDTRQCARVLTGAIGSASWSPDERTLAITLNNEIWLAPLDPNGSTIEALGPSVSIAEHHQERVAHYGQRIETDPSDAHWYLERAFHHHVLGDQERVLQDMEDYVATARRSEASQPGEKKFREFLRQVWRAKPVNLGPSINSRFNEYNVSVSHDGLSLYFSSDRPGGLGFLDLWVTTRSSVEEPWPAPVNLGSPVNASFSDEMNPSISADELSLYFCCARPRQYGDSGIWVSKRNHKGEPWGAPEFIGPLGKQSRPATTVSISADGLELYQNGVWIGDRSDNDVWVSTRATTEDAWGERTNLGPKINTDWTDSNPRISPDGLMLFYLYCWHGRDYRQLDLWVTTRTSKAEPWTTPVNLGPTLNTHGWETSLSMTADGSLLYFVSDREGTLGARDIWEMRIGPSSGISQTED